MYVALRSSLLFLAALLPIAAPAAATAQQDANRAAILTIIQNLADAWNRGDAHAFASTFAEDGSFTNIIGMQTYGRAPFEAQHQRIFATIYKGSHNEFTLGHLKFVRPDVAIADVDGVLSKMSSTPPGTPLFPDGSVHVKLQLVLSRNNSTWQIDSFHNVTVNPAAAGGPPAAN
ncbi:SgcJ/EcaC family oxidoreductase [Terriglobus aquaticus]|uniref:SgcJ/EcaC family oxidoreductase n=1 Tax=Terriglobus aquaticus TaxID=940139 RepID=A0ABW9KJ91_9BACT|nr:SgcJ/EcaC family oxidoreductase [Terriglobus aquaticus]